MNSIQTRETSLNRLEASLNTIFLNIGSAFQGSIAGDSEKLSRTRARVHKDIPPAFESFNDALDILEGDLIRSKAVLSRDIQMLHAENAGVTQANGETQAGAMNGLTNEVAEDQTRNDLTSSPVRIDKKQDLPNGNQQSPQTISSSPEITFIDPPAQTREDSQGEQQTPADNAAQVQTNGTSRLDDEPKNIKKEPANVVESQAQGTGNDASVAMSRESTKLPDASVTMQQSQTLGGQTNTSEHDSSKEEQAEPSPGNDFSALLPGLDTYANDLGGDGMGTIDSFTDINASNTFDLEAAGDGTINPFDNNDTSNDMGGDVDFDQLIAFDNNGGGDGDGQGGLDEFDDSFFNISST